MSTDMIDRQFTDEELVGRIKDGNTESLDVLVKVYLPKMYKTVQRLVPEHDAEDLTQEIFLSLVGSIGDFQGRSTFATWFHRMAMNKVADYYRKMSRRRKGEYNEEWNVMAVDPWECMEIELTLKEVLVDVPDRYREILLLKFLEGLSFNDIAERLGLTYEAARSRCRRAILMIRRKIGD